MTEPTIVDVVVCPADRYRLTFMCELSDGTVIDLWQWFSDENPEWAFERDMLIGMTVNRAYDYLHKMDVAKINSWVS